MKFTTILLAAASAVFYVVVAAPVDQDGGNAVDTSTTTRSLFFLDDVIKDRVTEQELAAIIAGNIAAVPALAPGISPAAPSTFHPQLKYDRSNFLIDCDHGMDAALDTTIAWLEILGRHFTYGQRQAMIPMVNKMCDTQMIYGVGNHSCAWMKESIRRQCRKSYCGGEKEIAYLRDLQKRYCGELKPTCDGLP